MNPKDAVRNQILRYFYDRNDGATSRFGKRGYAIKISDMRKDLKALHALTQQQVISNLTYLIDRGWVNVANVEKTVQVKGGTVPSTVTWYEISAQGIDKIEGDSEFNPVERYPGINITATGTNVITLGDGNVVNAAFKELHQQLDTLKEAMIKSDDFAESEKLDIAADIESIKDQLAKAKPNKTVISQLWSGIRGVVTAGELVQLVGQATPLIARVLS